MNVEGNGELIRGDVVENVGKMFVVKRVKETTDLVLFCLSCLISEDCSARILSSCS